MNNHLAVDTETTGLAFHDEAFGVSIFDGDGRRGRWYEVPGESAHVAEALGVESTASSLPSGSRMGARPDTVGFVFHNAKFDLQKLRLAGFDLNSKREIHDTEALAHLVDEHQPKKLKTLAAKYLGVETTEDAELKAYCRKKSNGINVKADGFKHVPREILVPYALKDAEYTYLLWEVLYPMVAKHEDLLGLYNMEMRLTWALLAMEEDGLGVNEDYVQETSKQYARDILSTEWEIEDVVGKKVWYPSKSGEKTPEGHFNPNSNDQIRAYFKGKGIEKPKYDKYVLAEVDDPFGPALIKLRQLKKIRNTYLLPMLNESRDGVLHPHTRQHGAKTGRMSSGKAEE